MSKRGARHGARVPPGRNDRVRSAQPGTQALAGKGGPTIEELRARGKPYYWNRDWLEQRLRETGSYTAVARMYPEEVRGASAAVIANYARLKYGWRRHATVRSKRREIIEEYDKLSGDIPQPALAAKYGVSTANVNRWIHEARRLFHEMAGKGLESAEARERFAQKHELAPETAHRWHAHGSDAYASNKSTRPKKRYHSRERYERVRAQVLEELKRDGKVNAKAAAERYQVEVSTVRAWLRASQAARAR